MSRVAVDIITGFLGAGKTTLLGQVLAGALEGEKVAVVMNEIGDIGVDGRVVTGLDYVENMVELNSGCICCTIDDYRFDLAIQELIETADPALIIMESTGLADPEPMAYRVGQAGLALDAVITVVDAENVRSALKSTKVARAQIETADFLVLNKIDLVDDSALRSLRRKLARLNPRAMMLEAERGRVGTDLPFGTSVRRFRANEGGRAATAVPDRSGRHLEEEGITALSIESPVELDQRRFESFLDRLPVEVYRAKGFVRLADNEWSCLFNYTCGRYELGWMKLPQEDSLTQAVFIGRNMDDLGQRLRMDLLACGKDRAWK